MSSATLGVSSILMGTTYITIIIIKNARCLPWPLCLTWKGLRTSPPSISSASSMSPLATAPVEEGCPTDSLKKYTDIYVCVCVSSSH